MKSSLRVFLISILILFSTRGFSQETQPSDTSYWQKGLKGTLTFTQVSLSNWAAGGLNSIALNSFVNMYLHHNKDRISWESNLDLSYGVIDQEGESLRKTDDKIQLLSKFGYQISASNNKLYWSSGLDFKTQWARGFDFPNDSVSISHFLAPGYIILTTGLEYKPSKTFQLLFSPVTGKITIVNNQRLANAGAFGVDAAVLDGNGNIITPGKKSRSELGTFINANFKKDIMENVNLESRAQFFTNYVEDFGTIDVNWEVIILMKINEYLTATLSTHLIFDKDVRFERTDDTGTIIGTEPRVQFKEIFGIGLSFSL